MSSYLKQAKAYLRTAEQALEAGNNGPAYENARTAGELAAKHLLSKAGVTPPKEHNVAAELVTANQWPSADFKRLSKFLGDHTRGIYGFHDLPSATEAKRGIQLAKEIVTLAEKKP